MRLTIGLKLFLALLLCTGGTLLVMALLAQWSLGRGFLNYINQVESERMEVFADHLATVYISRRNWRWLRDDPQALRRELAVLDQRRRSPQNRPPRLPLLFAGPPLPAPRPPAPRPIGPAPLPPVGGDARIPTDPAPLEQRLTVFDGNKQAVKGHARFSEAAQTVAIKVEEKVVGWLALEPLQQVTAMRDVRFLRQQSHRFMLIGGLLLALAAFAALVLARHLTRPLRQLTRTVQHLAAGNHAIRNPIKGRDETAELGHSINSLAHTLEANEEIRRRWFADISHELRTPLTVLRGELEALEDGVRPTDSKALGSLKDEIHDLSQLIDDLHELSLSDLGALSYRKQRLDLKELLTPVTTTFGTRIQSHDLTLEFVAERLPALPVYGDRQRLQQLFGNLLENAIRYTDAGGRIALSVVADGNTAIVSLEDTPPGVPPEVCDRLFERLYRVESSRSRTHGGSGLGLAICKNIVAAHEGSIRAEPSRLGGLAIIVKLPLLEF
ncbi:MAG: HAMP domain-containing protein [Gammaproteobacteria bacterium]|nr:HAMP domain-containing protein [Gammaproteobacteria bacterium]